MGLSIHKLNSRSEGNLVDTSSVHKISLVSKCSIDYDNISAEFDKTRNASIRKTNPLYPSSGDDSWPSAYKKLKVQHEIIDPELGMRSPYVNANCLNTNQALSALGMGKRLS